MIKYVTLKLFYRMIFLSEFVVFFFVMLKFLPQKYNNYRSSFPLGSFREVDEIYIYAIHIFFITIVSSFHFFKL